MQAIIMAGGKGTRMRPYTNILPKPLLPLGLRSILDINIRQLVECGFDEIIIAVGYLGELIESVIGNGDKYGVNIIYVYEDKPLGTVGALSLIHNKLDDVFIVMNGDILHDINFNSLMSYHNNNNADVTITTYTKENKVSLGVLKVRNEKIINYIEKPTNKYLVSMGIYSLSKNVVDSFILKNDKMDFPDLINILINNNKDVVSYNHKGLWIDLGTSEEYIKVSDNLEDISKKYPQIPLIL